MTRKRQLYYSSISGSAVQVDEQATPGSDEALAAAKGSLRTRKGARKKQAGKRATRFNLLAQLVSKMGHLVESVPDGVVIADEDGRILLVNRQTEALFGHDRNQLFGQPVETLIPQRYRAVHPTHRARYMREPHVRPMGSGLKLFGLRQDGTEFPVEISLSPITFAGSPLVFGTIRDVTEQRLLERRTQAALEGRLAVLQAILDELPAGVYLARGHDAELVLANRQIASVWGAQWPEGQPMTTFLAANGVRVFDLQGHELMSERLATVRALRSGQSVRQHQEIIRRPDGSSLAVLVNAVVLAPELFPILSGVGSVSGIGQTPMRDNGLDNASNMADAGAGAGTGIMPLVLVVHQDVGALVEAEQLKDEFVAMAAHELRNPVASLLGYAQMLVQAVGPYVGATQHRGGNDRGSPGSGQSDMLQQGEASAIPATTPDAYAIPPEWQEEAAVAVIESSQRLAALTDDLLDATRLQANRLELHREPLDLAALVRRVVKRVQITTQAHTIHVDIPDEPAVVEADRQRLEQVITNLLSNAVKYSPDGGPIEVVLTMELTGATRATRAASAHSERAVENAPETAAPADQGGEHLAAVVRVAVCDHGIGIPADQQQRIFGRFGRADNARERGIAGTGLGLYLSRELIERHGGRVWFASSEGAGTTVTVELARWVEPEWLP